MLVNSIHFLPSCVSQCNAGAYYIQPLSCNLQQLAISPWRIVILSWNIGMVVSWRPEWIGSLILRNVSTSRVGLECVCVFHECARVQRHLVYQPRG